MEDRNSVVLVLVVVGILSLVLMFRACSNPKMTIMEKPFTPKVSTPNGKKPVTKPRTYTSTPFGSSQTSKEVTEAKEVAAKLKEVNDKAGVECLNKMLHDPSVATLTREIYRMRNIPSMADGYALLFKGNLSEARDQFIKGFEDPESTPPVRYVACQYLMSISRQLKDPDGYFKWGKEMGKLLDKEDLSCIDQKKSKLFLDRITEKEILFKARNDRSLQEKIIDFYMTQMASELQTDQIRATVRDQVLNDIKRVEKEVLG